VRNGESAISHRSSFIPILKFDVKGNGFTMSIVSVLGFNDEFSTIMLATAIEETSI
jgi:hypothetical protein